MNGPIDFAGGLVRKAESDFTAAQLLLDAKVSLDAVCFHAQQAAEKYLKAYLAARDIDFPFVHGLERLIGLCADQDSQFMALLDPAAELSPYAVELRYDERFSPSIEAAQQAVRNAERIRSFVRERIPREVI